jgi:hypothetical protein
MNVVAKLEPIRVTERGEKRQVEDPWGGRRFAVPASGQSVNLLLRHAKER